ncbi:hypothetical protein NM688_g7304 [Phlebia brevispora]|uniref:Uncharacterized protein n=1 Tax=Phlebia brevispora TaxID=194682 RepID=A0ACC1S6S0_9APHY|nr:hypothetical protein NM688_g7304 [Phlebia brevispora]
MVEDAMRARAEQAESAAERLLELVDPEEENPQSSTIPASLLLHDTGPEVTPKRKSRDVLGSSGLSPKVSPPLTMPKTPVNKSAAILRKAALFQDSPAYNGKTSTSLFDIISGRANESAWWSKRKSLLSERSSIEAGEPSDHKEELNGYISGLERGTADIRVLKKLALLCIESPVNELISPISPVLSGPFSPSAQSGGARSLLSFKSDLWDQDKAFERLFSALMQYLDPARDVNELEYALIVLWELIEHQAPLLEGREAEIFEVLLRVRYCAHTSILQATTQFRDTLTSRIEPVYGLTVMHANIRTFRDSPLPALSDADIKNGTYAFGLIALGKFILRLPAEVLEDELPRLRPTLISALTDTSFDSSLNVREAAAASIIAAQLILRDEGRLFALLDGLPEDKKNLLTYLFDKHGCRGMIGEEQSGMEKLEREMRRLDGRTSTPLRPAASPFI